MTSNTAQAYQETVEAMRTLLNQHFNQLKVAAEEFSKSARSFQADLDLKYRWITNLVEKVQNDESCKALIADCDSFSKYMKDLNNVIQCYDKQLEKFKKE